MKKLVALTLLMVFVTLLGTSTGLGATRTTTATGGDWNAATTWSGGVVPTSGDAAVIVAGSSVTVTANTTVNSILFNNANASTATLTVNTSVVLTVTAGITHQNAAAWNTAATIQGAGTLNCASLIVGGTTTPTLTSSAFTATLTSTISNLSITGNLTISALYNSAQSAANQGTFALSSGSVNVGGSVVFATVPLFGPILTLTTGGQNGTLTLSGSTPFTTIGGGTSTFIMANSALVLTNMTAVPATPISFFRLTNSILEFSLANSTTNALVTTLTTGGAQNQINIASLPSISSTPKQFTLINYSGSIGGAGFNFVLGALPGGSAAYLSNNLTTSSVDLVVTNLFSTELAITSINGGSFPAADTTFSVVVQARDAGGTARNVTADTTVTLSLNAGSGTLGGTLTGTILAGTSSVTLTGVTYTKAEIGVVLTAARTTGDGLTAGNSSSFTVNPGAFTKLQLLMPGEAAAPGSGSGKTGSPNAQAVSVPFNVTVNAVDANWNLIATNDAVHISSSDGNAVLPTDAPLSAGTGTFSVTFQTAGGQTVTASDVTHPAVAPGTSPLTVANLGSQTISFPSPGNQLYGVAPITLNATASSGLMVSYAVTSGPAIVVGNILTITGAGSVAIQASHSGNTNWNAASPVIQTISVAQKSVTGSILASNKSYDGTTAATITNRTLTGVIGSDEVSLTGGTASFANKNVGTAKAVTATGLSLSGTDAANYQLASTTASTMADITARSLVVSAAGVNRVYDRTTNATVTLSDDRVPGDVLTTTYTNASFADKNVGTNKTVSVSGITISGTDVGNYTANSTATTTANITAKTLTVSGITANNKVYNGTTNATLTATNAALVGVVSGDALALSTNGAAGAFADKNVGTNKTVSVSGLAITGADSGNYALTQPSTTANITVRPLTVSATGVNKIYDRTTTATVTLSDNQVAGDILTASYATATFSSATADPGKTVTVGGISISGTDSGNYALGNTAATTTADITEKELTVSGITANNKVYNGTTAATLNTGSAALVGVVSGDNVILTGGGTGTFADKNVGTNKAVTVSGLALGGQDKKNYTLTQPGTTANITVRTLTVSATGVNKVYDGTTNATVTLSDNRVSGDLLTTSYTTASFANDSVGTGKTVTVSGISISGTDTGNYTANITATTTANITARMLTVSGITANNKVYDSTSVATLNTGSPALAGVLSGDTVTLSTAGAIGAFANDNVGTGKTVTVSGLPIGGADASNYALTPPTTTADITVRTLTVSATGVNRVYDGTINATVTLSDDRVSGDVLTMICTASFSNKSVGSNKTVNVSGISITGTDSGNYQLASTAASTVANVTPKALTISSGLTANNRVYDGTTTATLSSNNVVLAGVVSGDAVSLVTNGYTAAFATATVRTAKPVTLAGLILTGADAGNYTLTQPVLTANITAKALTIASGITANDKVYDGTATATLNSNSVVLVGVVGGDTVGLITNGYISTFASAMVGTGVGVTVSGITLAGSSAGNYLLTQPAGLSANITLRTLTVSAMGVNKVYDGTTIASVVLSDNRVAGDGLTTSFATASFGDKNVGNGKLVSVSGITISGTDSGNYAANVSASATADIIAATLTVTANDTNRVYGASNPSFTASCAGFVNGEDASVLSGSPLLSALTDINSPVGDYPIENSQGTLSNANYSFTLVNGTLTITAGIPVLSIEFVGGTSGQSNQITLRCAGLIPGGTCYIMASSDLGQWTEIGAIQAEQDGTITFINTTPLPIRFYRLVRD